MRSQPSRRFLRALWRDTRALVYQFRVSLLIFGSLLTVGTLALRLFYTDPQSGNGLGWMEAFHATLMLTLAEVNLPFPNKLGLQLLLLIIPLVGLSTVVDGVTPPFLLSNGGGPCVGTIGTPLLPWVVVGQIITCKESVKA